MLWAHNALPEALWSRHRSKLNCQSQRQEEAHIGHTLTTHSPHAGTHWHTHTHELAGPLWPQASVAHSRCVDAILAKNLPPYGNLRAARRSASVAGANGGGGVRLEAVIKSNTERIRSDVTQAVRADSTPCGMQKPSAEKLSMPQKKFPTIHPAPTTTQPCQRSHKHRSLESADILYSPACAARAWVCVGVGGENVQPNPTTVWSGLGWSRQLSQLQSSGCHATATLPNHLKHLNSTLIGLSLQLVGSAAGSVAIIVRQLAAQRLSYFCSYSVSHLFGLRSCIVVH